MSYDKEILYKLWLNILCRHNPELINKYIERLGSAREIYEKRYSVKSIKESVAFGRINNASRSLENAERLYESCKQKGIEIISIDDERYPRRLANIYCPPQLLYVKGTLPDIDNLVCVTIVGSRKCTDYSREFANKLARDLSESGIMVISGMALGIDGAAHSGALQTGHITLAALAGGADVVYPKANMNLYTQILKRGAVISEQPPGTIGKAGFYNQRNRILVGLSNGVVITEGQEKSGTKLTANWAIDANRDLFAVPGKPWDKGAELPNRLIKDSAKLITSAEDIIEEYISVYPVEIENGLKLIDKDKAVLPQEEPKGIQILEAEGRVFEKPKPSFEKFEGNSRIILEYLYNNKETVHIDDLSRECNVETTELSFIIIQLLMEKMIKEYPGEYYGPML
ncbi:MAG: DNA-processing protein DprA [Clostridia bacterium]|nr:DNA-processing protein DprA [Clostridia bacterium]